MLCDIYVFILGTKKKDILIHSHAFAKFPAEIAQHCFLMGRKLHTASHFEPTFSNILMIYPHTAMFHKRNNENS